jgi:hypothetical protein
MDGDLKLVQDHFAAGRTEEAIQQLPEQLRRTVEARSIDDLMPWCARNRAETISLEAHRLRAVPAGFHEVEGDDVIARALIINDNDGAVFAIPNATMAAGHGMISTEDSRVISIASDWGKAWKAGERAALAYRSIVVRPGTDDFLATCVAPTTRLAEAGYLWVGVKHFGINLINLVHMAMLREALGDSDLPLVAQRKGLPPRRFERDAIRKMGFANNEIITIDNAPTTIIDKLWVPHCPITFFPRHIVSCSAGMNIFRRRIGVAERSKSSPGERIYVTRRDAKWRHIEDEGSLIAMLRDEFGFRVVEFTGMELDQRIEALADASIILGSTGQNLFNMMFAPPGCWIGEILPRSHADIAVRDAIAHMALSMGHNLVRIPSDSQATEKEWSRWNIIIRERETRAGVRFLLEQAST